MLIEFCSHSDARVQSIRSIGFDLHHAVSCRLDVNMRLKINIRGPRIQTPEFKGITIKTPLKPRLHLIAHSFACQLVFLWMILPLCLYTTKLLQRPLMKAQKTRFGDRLTISKLHMRKQTAQKAREKSANPQYFRKRMEHKLESSKLYNAASWMWNPVLCKH